MASEFEQFAIEPREFSLGNMGEQIAVAPDAATDPKTIVMIIGMEAGVPAQIDSERTFYRHRRVEGLLADILTATGLTGNTLPRGILFTINGEVWTLHESESIRAGWVVLIVIIPQRQPTDGRQLPGVMR